MKKFSSLLLSCIIVAFCNSINAFPRVSNLLASAVTNHRYSSVTTRETLLKASNNNFFSNLLSNLQFWKSEESIERLQTADSPKPDMLEPSNAVLVFGATGLSGEKITKKLIESGRDVVIASRNGTKAKELFSDYIGNNNVFLRDSIDVTDYSTISTDLFNGVTQIVCALGPVFKNPILTAENVDYKGTVNLIEKFKKIAGRSSDSGLVDSLISFQNGNSRDLQRWNRLDDVIMGGRSSSKWCEVDWSGEGSKFCRWSGKVITDGGGFCGTIVKDMNFPTENYDGIKLRVRGDGNRYKFRLKPWSSDESDEASVYQSSFDTVAGQWTEIMLPFDTFIAVRRNSVNYFAPKVNKVSKDGRMSSIGLVLSRFEYNERPNPKFSSGEFRIDVEAIDLYRKERPSVVLVSSAGTERINKLTTAEQRATDIPIVQLNPQGILNWKYKAEEHLRLSGLPYTIIRATGLVSAPNGALNSNKTSTNDADTRSEFAVKRRLQAGQGDVMAGRITRDELADLVLSSIDSPYSTGKTFEVRRDESDSGLLSTASSPNNWGVIEGIENVVITSNADLEECQDFSRLFRSLVSDADRIVGDTNGVFLPPFPPANDPPAPVPPERVQEILNDPRVKSQQSRDKSSGTENPNRPTD